MIRPWTCGSGISSSACSSARDWSTSSCTIRDILPVIHWTRSPSGEGGLSFHGALLGMAIASFVFARRQHVSFAVVADTLALAGPPGLFFGRIGNFINGELYGRPTTVPWAMVFPTDPSRTPRHPSQLYEAVCEGLVLSGMIWALERRAVTRGWYRPGVLTGAFLIGYGVLRFLIEFTRQPDAQVGFVVGPFTMGQILCTVMVASGVIVLAQVYRGSDRRGVSHSTAEQLGT